MICDWLWHCPVAIAICYCLTKCKINKIYHFRMLIDSFNSVPGIQLNSKVTHRTDHCYGNWICGLNLKFPLKCAYFLFFHFIFGSIDFGNECVGNVFCISILVPLFGFVFVFDFNSFWFSFQTNKESDQGTLTRRNESLWQEFSIHLQLLAHTKWIPTSEMKRVKNAWIFIKTKHYNDSDEVSFGHGLMFLNSLLIYFVVIRNNSERHAKHHEKRKSKRWKLFEMLKNV